MAAWWLQRETHVVRTGEGLAVPEEGHICMASRRRTEGIRKAYGCVDPNCLLPSCWHLIMLQSGTMLAGLATSPTRCTSSSAGFCGFHVSIFHTPACNHTSHARRVGDIADAVFFILKGTVSISDESGRLLTKLAQGSHFGEFGILAYLDGQLGGWRVL